MKSPREHALALLSKADHDLVAAKATIATGKALDMVCFHAQHAAGKSLKALLAMHDVVYPYRHDMGELIELVKKRFPSVVPLEDDLLALSPYAVELRYDDALEPSISETGEALNTAIKVYAFAEKIIAS